MREMEIIAEVVAKTAEILGDDYTVDIKEVEKNNGSKRRGLIIDKEGEKFSTVCYIDDMIEEIVFGTMTIEEAAANVVEEAQTKKPFVPDFDANIILTREYMLKNCKLQVINYAANEYRLKDMPHTKLLDLAAICRINVECTFGYASCAATNEMLSKANVTEEEILTAAYENTKKAGFQTVNMADIYPEPEADEAQMYVITTEKGADGSAALMYPEILRELADKVEDDLLIIPSSINELLVHPASGIPTDDMKMVIREVNAAHVSPDEVLSDHPYIFGRNDGFLNCI